MEIHKRKSKREIQTLNLSELRCCGTSFSLTFNSRVHNLTFHRIGEIASHVFGSDLTNLEYEDEAGIVSNCWAPSSYFDDFAYMTKVRQQFNEVSGYELEENSQLFQFIHNIRKIMSLREAIKLWAEIIVPSDIFFRSKSSRILNPYYVKRIGYA